MEAYEVRAGEVVFSEGEIGEYACIIRSGRVQILKHTPQGEVELAVLDEGEVFGEMALFEPRDARSATARALDHVIVDVLSAAEMHQMLEESPLMLQPFISALVTRLRVMNRRLAEKERATLMLGNAIHTVRIEAASDALKPHMSMHEVKVTNFPFTIGGYAAETESAPGRTNLQIPCHASPMNISYEHCGIEQHEDGIYLVDYGSRFRTMVNECIIGRGEASGKALLLPGENDVTLGDPSKEMRLKLTAL